MRATSSRSTASLRAANWTCIDRFSRASVSERWTCTPFAGRPAVAGSGCSSSMPAGRGSTTARPLRMGGGRPVGRPLSCGDPRSAAVANEISAAMGPRPLPAVRRPGRATPADRRRRRPRRSSRRARCAHGAAGLAQCVAALCDPRPVLRTEHHAPAPESRSADRRHRLGNSGAGSARFRSRQPHYREAGPTRSSRRCDAPISSSTRGKPDRS